MSDSLSHACPTCKGNVILGIHYLSDPYTGEALPPQEEICPDCIDGVYPKAAVERAAKALWDIDRDTRPTDVGLTHFAELDDHLREFYEELALAAIRAFHNERSEG